MTNWEEKDRRITAGAIKGNCVTNAVTLYCARLGIKGAEPCTLESCVDEIVELHKYTESLDILALIDNELAIKPVKKVTKVTHIKAIKSLPDFQGVMQYVADNKQALKLLNDKDKEAVKEVIRELKPTKE